MKSTSSAPSSRQTKHTEPVEWLGAFGREVDEIRGLIPGQLPGQARVVLVHVNRGTGGGLQGLDAAHVVKVAVGQENGLDREAQIGKGLSHPLALVAGVDDGAYLGGLVGHHIAIGPQVTQGQNGNLHNNHLKVLGVEKGRGIDPSACGLRMTGLWSGAGSVQRTRRPIPPCHSESPQGTKNLMPCLWFRANHLCRESRSRGRH